MASCSSQPSRSFAAFTCQIWNDRMLQKLQVISKASSLATSTTVPNQTIAQGKTKAFLSDTKQAGIQLDHTRNLTSQWWVRWHQTSDIIPLSSDIWHQTSVIRHLSSDVWQSDVWHQMFDIRHLSSDIRHLSSEIWNETSDIIPLP